MSFPYPRDGLCSAACWPEPLGFFMCARRPELRRQAPAAVPEPAKRVPRGFGTTLYMHFDSDRVLKFEPSISDLSGLTCGELTANADKPGEACAASGEQKTQGPCARVTRRAFPRGTDCKSVPLLPALSSFAPRKTTVVHAQCRLSLRERAFFRGAKDDWLRRLVSPFAPRKGVLSRSERRHCRLSLRERAFFRGAKDDTVAECRLSLRERAFFRGAKDDTVAFRSAKGRSFAERKTSVAFRSAKGRSFAERKTTLFQGDLS